MGGGVNGCGGSVARVMDNNLVTIHRRISTRPCSSPMQLVLLHLRIVTNTYGWWVHRVCVFDFIRYDVMGGKGEL